MWIPGILGVLGIIKVASKDDSTLEFVDETVFVELAPVYLHEWDDDVVFLEFSKFAGPAMNKDAEDFLDEGFDPGLGNGLGESGSVYDGA
jgi:hypothetical protein